MKNGRLLGFCMAALVMLSGTAHSATLDRMRQEARIRVAYRLDAPPFSFQSQDAQPAGLIVDLCKAVVKRLSQQINLPALKVTYVPVTAADRFEAIQQGKADLLCEATTVTVSRRRLIDFSLYTFVDGASLLTTADGPKSLPEMAGRSIGVVIGTTTEQALRNTLLAMGISANVDPVASHAEGLRMLDSGRLVAYFADRSILWVLQANSKSPDRLLLANEFLTVEPYALGLPKGDDGFRYEVDRALSGVYRSGEINDILAQTFGINFQLGPILQTLYLISAMPE